jgi:hypothetical protein
MVDPKSAFNENPHAQCTIDLTLEAVGRPWGGEPEWEEGEVKPDLDPKMFARGHRTAHVDHGKVMVGEERFDITDAPACATTRGDRASGRTSGGTAGSSEPGPSSAALTISGSQEDPDAHRAGGFSTTSTATATTGG